MLDRSSLWHLHSYKHIRSSGIESSGISLPQFPWLLGTFQLLAYLTHITGNGFAKASVAERRDGAPA
jgi:hypothetical protein